MTSLEKVENIVQELYHIVQFNGPIFRIHFHEKKFVMSLFSDFYNCTITSEHIDTAAEGMLDYIEEARIKTLEQIEKTKLIIKNLDCSGSSNG